MRRTLCAGAALLALAFGPATQGQERPLGSDLQGLLSTARQSNPEFASLQFEADAAAERVLPAGALPDPRFSMELRDLTRMGERNASLLPGRVGSTRYIFTQELPWFGKRDLKRAAAALQAEAAQGRVAGSWNDLASKIKAAYAQLYYLDQSERLTREILDLMARLEKVAQVRYASGLAAQQDVIRAQLEQTALRSERIALDAERRQWQARLNALLGRPAGAPLASPEHIRPLPAPERMRFDVLESRVRASNPVLRAEESQVQAAEKGRELAYKNRYPDFAVGISPVQYGKSIREWELMVEVTIPLQQDTRRAQEREAHAMLEAARARRDVAANQVLAELYENIAALEAARHTLTLTTDSLLPQSELGLRSALAGYESGKVDFATLLDAQKQIRQARLSQVKAGVAAQARLADIERILGEEP